MSGTITIVTDGPETRGQKIKIALRNLFGNETKKKHGIYDPIDENQKRTFLGFVVPEIEGAYDLQVYTLLEDRLRQTEEKLRQTEDRLRQTQRNLEQSEGRFQQTRDSLGEALEEIRGVYRKFDADPESRITEILGDGSQ